MLRDLITWIRLFFARRAAYAALLAVEDLEGPMMERLRREPLQRELEVRFPEADGLREDLVFFPEVADLREDLIWFPAA